MQGEKKTRRPKRGAADFLDLDEIRLVLDTAWDLSDGAGSLYATRIYQQALKCEIATFTSLRNAEIHAMRPSDIRWESGTLRVGTAAKGAKPRVTAFVNGLAASPTLQKIRDWLEHRGRALDDRRPLWTSGEKAWHHWVTYRLGPASGLQREIDALTGAGGKRLWRIHPHTFRAAFVMVCRRAPLEHGLDPLSWQAIAELGGWESSAVVERYYYVCDLPNVLREVGAKLSPALAAR